MIEYGDVENALFHALLSVDRLAATKLLTETTTAWTPSERIERLVPPVMRRIGEEWENQRVSLAQMYMSGLICEDIVGSILSSQSANKKNQSSMAIVTLEDHHSLGRKIVASFIRTAGFELIDYGQGVTVDDLFMRLKRDGIKIILISTLMLRSALKVKTLRERLNAEGLDVKVVAGGAPFMFDPQLWKEVGADVMARTASEAVSIIEKLIGEAQ